MCVKEKTAVLSQQGWTWQSADRPFKNNGTNIIFFCSNKSKIEAAFRDKVSMSAVNTTFPFVDSAKVGNYSMHIPAFPSLNITFCEQRKKEETSTRR